MAAFLHKYEPQKSWSGLKIMLVRCCFGSKLIGCAIKDAQIAIDLSVIFGYNKLRKKMPYKAANVNRI